MKTCTRKITRASRLGWEAALAAGLLGCLTATAEPRFEDRGDGTVTDRATGLTWLRQADAAGAVDWNAAIAACRALSADTHEGLNDGSNPGDWRLPDPFELQSLTAAATVGGALEEGHPFEDVQSKAQYWTAAAGFYDSASAWQVAIRGGRLALVEKTQTRPVWPVRGRSDRLPRHQGRVTDLADTYDGLSSREKQRAELTALWDVSGFRLRDEFAVVRSEEFLTPPPALAEALEKGGHAIAGRAPAIKWRLLPHLEPEFFPEGEAYQAGWANWAKIARSEDNRFYMAASDHRGRGAKLNLYEYRPDDGPHGTLERVLDVSAALGWHDEMYTDGKIHGSMGIMPDGNLWAATHRGPEPTDEWYAAGYRGSWLFSYNIHTRVATNWGVPMIGQELPTHVLDAKRGIFVGTGHLTASFLCWDVNTGRARYAGAPPNGWRWHARSLFLDPDTGYFWGVDFSEEPYRFMSFDPELARFKRHDVPVPTHPETGKQTAGRLHCTPRAVDGWYYNVLGSTFFRWRPDWEKGPEVEAIGTTFGDTIQLAMSPERDRVYWVPRRKDTLVVMRYDIATGRKTALGFFKAPLVREFGYTCGLGAYGVNISRDGSFLVILDNGGFGRAFGGHPALFLVELADASGK